MTPELERMARAMWRAREKMFWPERVQRPVPDEIDMATGAYAVVVEMARAGLEAIKEPSDQMLRRAFVAMNETPSGQWKRMKAEGVTPRRLFDVKMAPRWRAMIDHILGATR